MTAMSSRRHLQVICEGDIVAHAEADVEEPMRMLVVEDEARIRAFLARAFEAEGFTVDVVEDGEQGLDAGARRAATTS